MDDSILILSYGTLTKHFRLHHQIKKRCQSEIETIKENVLIGGYKLAVNQNHAFPIAFPCENASIRGSILSVNSRTAREIIEVESDYFMKIVFVEHQGEWFRCLFFWSFLKYEKPLKHKSFLSYARQHNLPSLMKRKT